MICNNPQVYKLLNLFQFRVFQEKSSHGFRITGTRFQSLSVELGFSIPIASGIL